jgi:hypothetical protein
VDRLETSLTRRCARCAHEDIPADSPVVTEEDWRSIRIGLLKKVGSPTNDWSALRDGQPEQVARLHAWRERCRTRAEELRAEAEQLRRVAAGDADAVAAVKAAMDRGGRR